MVHWTHGTVHGFEREEVEGRHAFYSTHFAARLCREGREPGRTAVKGCWVPISRPAPTFPLCAFPKKFIGEGGALPINDAFLFEDEPQPCRFASPNCSFFFLSPLPPLRCATKRRSNMTISTADQSPQRQPHSASWDAIDTPSTFTGNTGEPAPKFLG